jgi:hypothetical protein
MTPSEHPLSHLFDKKAGSLQNHFWQQKIVLHLRKRRGWKDTYVLIN